MDAKTVFLVEPCTLLREGFARILEENGYQVVGQSEALGHAAFFRDPPTLLIATAMALDVAGALKRARMEWPLTKLVVLEEPGQKPFSSPRKVDGYLSKELPVETLLKLLEVVSLGHQVIQSGGGRSANAHAEETDALSSSEAKLLSLLAEGQSNLAIAEQLAINEPEVKRQVRILLKKLRVKNRTQAAVWAISRGWWSGRRRRSESGGENGCVTPLKHLRPVSISMPIESA
jgi:two-component system, NarL family, nitrate/nitrite response regulator NarL